MNLSKKKVQMEVANNVNNVSERIIKKKNVMLIQAILIHRNVTRTEGHTLHCKKKKVS